MQFKVTNGNPFVFFFTACEGHTAKNYLKCKTYIGIVIATFVIPPVNVLSLKLEKIGLRAEISQIYYNIIQYKPPMQLYLISS